MFAVISSFRVLNTDARPLRLVTHVYAWAARKVAPGLPAGRSLVDLRASFAASEYKLTHLRALGKGFFPEEAEFCAAAQLDAVYPPVGSAPGNPGTGFSPLRSRPGP